MSIGFKNLRSFFVPIFVLAIVNANQSVAQDSLSLTHLLGGKENTSEPKEIFSLADTNNDQIVTREEFRQRKMEVFFKRDENRNGQLSRQEFSNVSSGVFDSADANKDGNLSSFEFHQSNFVKFDAVDLNKNGKITYQEFVDYRQSLK